MFDNDNLLVDDLLKNGKFDGNRGNFKVDTGFASAMSQLRDPNTAFISVQAKLKRTDETMFIKLMLGLSRLTNLLSMHYNLGPLFRVDNIDAEWA